GFNPLRGPSVACSTKHHASFGGDGQSRGSRTRLHRDVRSGSKFTVLSPSVIGGSGHSGVAEADLRTAAVGTRHWHRYSMKITHSFIAQSITNGAVRAFDPQPGYEGHRLPVSPGSGVWE